MDGEVSAALSPGAWSLEGAPAGNFALDLLEELGIEAQLLSVEELGAETVVTVRQLWEGTPVFDCTAVLVYRDGALREILPEESRRLTGAPQAAPAGEALDLPTSSSASPPMCGRMAWCAGRSPASPPGIPWTPRPSPPG